MVAPVKLFSELGYDMLRMFLFFATGRFASEPSKQERFFGADPTARDAVISWAKAVHLTP